MSDKTAFCIERLDLNRFRNYHDVRVEAGQNLVVLTGLNGAGKTNLLEAISLLVPGRGLRAVPFGDLLRHTAQSGEPARTGQPGDDCWTVSARTAGPCGVVQLGTAYQTPVETAAAQGPGTARKVRIDGTGQRSSGALGAYMQAAWLTPAMDRMFAGPAGDRRRFFDRLVCAFDPEHRTRTSAFERVMRERNRLIGEAAFDHAWLAGLERQMAELGVAIAAGRNMALEVLQGHMDAGPVHASPAPFPFARLTIEGELEAALCEKPAVQVEDEYRKVLYDSRQLDRAAGRTLQGPHRSDFAVFHGPGAMPARSCSTGEQKALLIGIILAHARAVRAQLGGWAPVLLLDEVAAHLDAGRRAALFAALRAIGGQVWMTGTEQSLFDGAGPEAQYFEVAGNTVLPGS